MSAWWIALEGGEGAGKSTQASRLATHLGAVLSREPGGTSLGARIRELLLDPAGDVDPRAETLLMAADRAQHVAELVVPALRSGRTVVSDRSAFSSLAYQGCGRGLGVDEVRTISAWASGGVWPDLVVLLDLPDDVRAARMEREHDRLEAAGAAFHDRVNEAFRAMAADDPERWVVVDGSLSFDDVEVAIAGAVDGWIARHG